MQLQSQSFELKSDFGRALCIMKSNSLAAEAIKLPRRPFSSFFKSVHEPNKRLAAEFSNETLKDVFIRPSKIVNNYIDEPVARITNLQERDLLIGSIETENLTKTNKCKVLLELFQQYPLSAELLGRFPFKKFKIDIKEGVFTQIETCKKNKLHECFSQLVGVNPSLKEVYDWIDEFALGKLKYYRVQDEKNVIDETKACMDGTRWTDCSAVCTKAGWNMFVEKCSKDSYIFGPGTLINTILSDSCGPEWSSTDRVAALTSACSALGLSIKRDKYSRGYHVNLFRLPAFGGSQKFYYVKV